MAWTLNPSAISYEPKIKSRTVQGERNRDGAQVAIEEDNGEDQDCKEIATGQSMVPDELLADVSVHGFWKWGTTALSDIQIVN